MVGRLASRATDCGVESRSGKTKDHKIGMCCFSAKHTAWARATTCGVGIRIMCPSGVTCLSVDCCISDLALYKVNIIVMCLAEVEDEFHYTVKCTCLYAVRDKLYDEISAIIPSFVIIIIIINSFFIEGYTVS